MPWGHVSLLRFIPTRPLSLVRVRPPRRSPSSSLLPRAPQPFPIGRRSGCPVDSGLPQEGERLFCSDRGALPRPAVRRALITGSPYLRKFSVEGVGPPRFLGCPLRTCHSPRPRRPQRLLAKSSAPVLPSAPMMAWAARKKVQFRGYPSAAHTFACSRIAYAVTDSSSVDPAVQISVAIIRKRKRRANYRPARLGFGRAGFAPAGQQTEFQGFIALLLFQRTSIS